MDNIDESDELGYFDSLVVKAYPHVQAYAFINIGLLVATIGAFIFLAHDFGEAARIANIVIAAALAAAFVATLICTTFSGFVGVVVLDGEGASQKRWGKTIKWRWEDITDIACTTHCPWMLRGQVVYPKFRLRCSAHDKVLVFTWNKDVDKYFTELCTKEEINAKFKELLSACDYNYPGRFDNNNVTKNEEAERNMAASIRTFRINSLSLACLAVAGLILLLATDIAEWILIVVLFAGIAINLAVNLIIWLVKRSKNK